MKHLNGKFGIAFDVRLTGKDPSQNEIIEVGALLLDQHFDIVQNSLPFQVLIRPSGSHTIADDVKISNDTLLRLTQYGQDHDTALDFFCRWLDRLPVNKTRYGTTKTYVLVGYGLHMKLPFVMKWMGADMFHSYFSEDIRDIRTAGLFMNDLTGSKMEKVPYNKTTLTWIASKHNLEHRDYSKDVIIKLRMIAETYSRMCFYNNVM